MFLGKGVLKICSKFTREHPCQRAISIKLLFSFIEIALRHGFSPVKLLYIFRTPSLNNISERLLLYIVTHVAQLNFYLLIPCSAESVIFLTPDVKSHNRPYIKGHRYLNIPAAESCRFVIVCMTF